MNSLMLVDTHCHLDFDSFSGEQVDVVARAQAAGVEKIIVPATDLEGLARVAALADQFAAVFIAVGIHPNSSAGWQDEWIERVREYASHPKVVAIGEIGLDYYRTWSPPPIQRRCLQAQLELATELKLPVILHNRQADDDLLGVIEAGVLSGGEQAGVFHSFSSGRDVAERVLELGFYLGFSGPVTYKNADTTRSIVSEMPADRFLVETDAPFLAPHPFRGKRNEPAYARLIAERIAGLRSVSLEALAAQTTQNAVELFGRRMVSS